jgi:hypothetical protein
MQILRCLARRLICGFGCVCSRCIECGIRGVDEIGGCWGCWGQSWEAELSRLLAPCSPFVFMSCGIAVWIVERG